MLSIGQLAKQTGVTVETVRFYERQGLIDCPPRSESGYRQYPLEAVGRVRFIQNAKDVGFSLKDIAGLLSLRQEPGTTCEDIKVQAMRKIEEVDQKLHELRRIRDALAGLIEKCNTGGSVSQCPILEELDEVSG